MVSTTTREQQQQLTCNFLPMTGGLDEQSVILYVAHLCSRLLDVSKEDRAAAVITRAFRRLLWEKKYGENRTVLFLYVTHVYFL
jgi:hypothetical protein